METTFFVPRHTPTFTYTHFYISSDQNKYAVATVTVIISAYFYFHYAPVDVPAHQPGSKSAQPAAPLATPSAKQGVSTIDYSTGTMWTCANVYGFED